MKNKIVAKKYPKVNIIQILKNGLFFDFTTNYIIGKLTKNKEKFEIIDCIFYFPSAVKIPPHKQNNP